MVNKLGTKYYLNCLYFFSSSNGKSPKIWLWITVMLPVLGEMATKIGRHPLYLMFPAALSCSMAFHTPVGMYF